MVRRLVGGARGAASAPVSSRPVSTYEQSHGDDDNVKRGAKSCILGLIVRFPNDFVVLSRRGRDAATNATRWKEKMRRMKRVSGRKGDCSSLRWIEGSI